MRVPFRCRALKRTLELVILQKEQNVKYFPDRNSLAFYIVELVAHCFKAFTDKAKTALNMRFVFTQNSTLSLLARHARSCTCFAHLSS